MSQKHRKAARRHATIRAWERYGLVLAPADLLEVEKRIWAGKAEWIEDQRDMRQVYRARVKKRKCVVIFDIRLDAIVTVLPDAWATKRKRQQRRAA